MYTLGCSARIRERLDARPTSLRLNATTRLGDWYAHQLEDHELVLCVSLKTLLPVLVELRPGVALDERLAAGVRQVLGALGVPPADIDAEVAEMQAPAIGRTTRRWVNDALRDFEWLLEARLAGGHRERLEVALWLAETPCVLLSWKSPDEATRELFGLSPARHRFGPPLPQGTAPGALAAPPPEPSWSPALAIGIAEIDAQHQGLFEACARLDQLRAGDAGEAARLLDFLGRYVVEHFAAEERAMGAAGFPGAATHTAEHDALVDELKGFHERWRREGPSAELGAALGARLRSWLSFHIGGSDRVMGRFLLGVGRS